MDIRHAVGVKVGIEAARLAALSEWETSAEFSPRERAALRFATAIVREGDEVTDECFDEVRRHFSEPDTVELTFIVGYQTFASKFAKAFQLSPQGFTREAATA
jgi:alkylhydroperoxidase family enzyme